MSTFDPVATPLPHTGIAEVNGTRLYHEVHGAGPALLLIPGASGDAGMYRNAVEHLAANFTVVTYDRRGNSRSVAPEGWAATSVDEQADDAAALLSALDIGPAFVFGNSSGATIAINLSLRHPEALRGVVAHEPPKVGVLPNRDEFLAHLKERMAVAVAEGGYGNAMPVFHGWLVGNDTVEVELQNRVHGNGENWVTRELGIIDRYDPPPDLVEGRQVPLVIGVGTAGGTEFHTDLLDTYTDALRNLAVGLSAAFASFSGAHVPYESIPDVFAAELRRILAELDSDDHLRTVVFRPGASPRRARG